MYQRRKSFFLLIFLCAAFPQLLFAQVPDKAYDDAIAAFSSVACEDTGLLERNRELIGNLSFTNKLVLQSFSRLQGISADELVDTLQRLQSTEVRFSHQEILARFVTLQGADVENSWLLLTKLAALDFSAGRVMSAFVFADMVPAPVFLDYVDRVAAMSEPAGWALKAFLLLPGQTAETVASAMDMLEKMSVKQQWATEKSCQIQGMNAYYALHNMARIRQLSATDAWNARGLFQENISVRASLAWLQDYFILDKDGEEAHFFTLTPTDKSTLLKAFANSSDYLTWKINDLHSITNKAGREIPAKTLTGGSADFLEKIWLRLDEKVRTEYRTSFYRFLKKGKKGSAVSVLRVATAKARVQVARDMTTANIYILLSKGSELYDSSFRDILVPVLAERMAAANESNLLQFLLAVDPDNKHVSDFIISLAQRGKLAVFFPKDADEQKQVLDLVTASAFQDENSLILFSATFMKLLESIEPETRSYLIANMLTAIREENTVFTIQLRVILQYYLQYYSDYVGEVDRIRINMMMYEYGAVPLQYYSRTAFAEWKSDGRLSSLSVFHADDDGRQSYISNCSFLYKQGYRPRLSRSFDLSASPDAMARAAELVAKYTKSPKTILPQLFKLQVENGLLIDWVKRVNGIEISHSTYIFQGKTMQEELLKQFLLGDHEMFAQRGHSYWRKEQLIEPIHKLIKDGKITAYDLAAKQRFMSLGSCGGIQAYSELATLFNNNVDILATVGTGKAVVNNPYNEFIFEVVAKSSDTLSWDDVARKSAKIFKRGLGEDYLQPGSLPAILHKIMDQKSSSHAPH